MTAHTDAALRQLALYHHACALIHHLDAVMVSLLASGYDSSPAVLMRDARIAMWKARDLLRLPTSPLPTVDPDVADDIRSRDSE